jgi:hypothetical protein
VLETFHELLEKEITQSINLDDPEKLSMLLEEKKD